MLRKLYKHEFISLYRVLLPLYGVLLGLSVLTRVLSEIGKGNNALDAWKTLVISLSVVTMIGIFVVGFVVIIVRFYQNLLTKQGYLTNTLPFKAHNHIFCKLICGVAVELSNIVLATAALAIMLGTKAAFNEIWLFVKELFVTFSKTTSIANTVAMTIEVILLFALGIATSIMMFYASMAIGQQFKNKILSSVIAYFCIYAAIQIINTFFIVFAAVIGLNTEELFANSTVTAVSQTMIVFIFAIIIVQALIYFFITNYFLSKKLNLE